jgi:hypothetical protein
MLTPYQPRTISLNEKVYTNSISQLVIPYVFKMYESYKTVVQISGAVAYCP